MKKYYVVSTIKYYLLSIPEIIFNFNFWTIFFLCFRKTVKIRVKDHGLFWVRNLLDVWTLKEVLINNVYRLDKNQKSEVVIDIGSALGDFSIEASRISKKVYAFDLDKDLVELMIRNLEVNSIKNVTLEKREVKSLDEIFKTFSIKRCNLLKIDCEGWEYEIFNKSKDSVVKKIHRMVFEIHLFKKEHEIEFAKLKKRLKRLKFNLEEIGNPVHPYLKYLYVSSKD